MAQKILVYRIAILILCLIGSGFVAGGVWWMSGIKRINTEYVSTKAKIEKIEKHTERHRRKTSTHYRVIVSYLANDKVYTNELGAYSSSMSEGDSITVQYNPKNVTEIRSTDVEYVISVVFIAVGGVLLISAMFMPMLFRSLNRQNN